VVDVGLHLGYSVLEGNLWSPAEHTFDLAGICPGASRLAWALRELDTLTANQVRQMSNGLWFAASDIEHFAPVFRLGCEQKGAGDVSNVDEVTPLRAVPDHRQGFAVQALSKEDSEDSAICAGRAHTRPIGVEDPH
jgi:hypothetical protein